jgi:hypothetical protein
MNARILKTKYYPAAWVFRFPPIKPGTIVPVVEATNIPDQGTYWVNTPELADDAYGILLYPGDYELILSSEVNQAIGIK